MNRHDSPDRRHAAAWCGGWLLAAGWAGAFPLLSGLGPHRAWGTCAAVGYLLAALAALLPTRRSRSLSLALALTGAVAVPLLALVLTGRGQSEVGVIERSGALLLHTGTPYLAEPRTVAEYTPYLPGMALLGLPRALLDGLPLGGLPLGGLPLGGLPLGGLPLGGLPLARVAGDARLWCAAAFLACLLRSAPAGRRTALAAPTTPPLGPRTALAALTASPVVALPLCVSGVDLPMTGLCWLALTLAARRRPVPAGLALAAACSLKWTAWPAVAVVTALLAATAGRRPALRAAAVAVGGTALLVLPGALRSPGPMLDQVFAFPTGRGDLPTPAASPLPGRLLADLGPPGWYAAVGLLLLAALALAASLLTHPPRHAAAAADRLALGLALAFLLAPAGRFGYLALPLLLVLLARLLPPALPAPSAPTPNRGLTRPWAAHSSSPTTSRPAKAASKPSSTPWPPACPTPRSWSTPPPSRAPIGTTPLSPSR
ncbi:glycosyltransferase 87 family protein [Kitasatospora sp. NPDC086801]|uniref:glycosyltransferase 87 family protein n=1 Tax=Kitasatospora sp. NPDC086801 TaxID=3364066 RepID=UPI0038087549